MVLEVHDFASHSAGKFERRVPHDDATEATRRLDDATLFSIDLELEQSSIKVN